MYSLNWQLEEIRMIVSNFFRMSIRTINEITETTTWKPALLSELWETYLASLADTEIFKNSIRLTEDFSTSFLTLTSIHPFQCSKRMVGSPSTQLLKYCTSPTNLDVMIGAIFQCGSKHPLNHWTTFERNFTSWLAQPNSCKLSSMKKQTSTPMSTLCTPAQPLHHELPLCSISSDITANHSLPLYKADSSFLPPLNAPSVSYFYNSTWW